MPIKELGDQAPEYDRPWVESAKRPVIRAEDAPPPVSNSAALLTLLGSPDYCSKRWIWEQYDHLILGNTFQPPGGDSAVIRLGDGPKGLALTCDVTPRYCEADPFEGGKQAVAEAWRNLCATGALPIALTDNLNFGNPEKPEIMGQFVGCIKGIGAAAKALDFPVVSGNVSLYNETNGRGILPTPSIGGVGLFRDVTRAIGIGFAQEGDAIILIGKTEGWLGASAWLAQICGREEGAPPPVDLVAEKTNGEVARWLIETGHLTACHDLSDGGLALALAEMALAGNRGATIFALPEGPRHAVLFGEDQGRYLITVKAKWAARVLEIIGFEGSNGLHIGTVGGESLTIEGETPISVAALRQAYEHWLPAYMAGH